VTIGPVVNSASADGATPERPPRLPREQADRVWSLALHLDAEFTQRGNFFLVGESMLVVAYAAILATAQPAGQADGLLWTARVIAGFGVVLALLWCYIQGRHMDYLHSVRGHLLRNFPEYEEIYEYRRTRQIHTSAVMAYAIPAITTTMWVALALLI
jgi:hypothetical protein